ncbi:hypothetical protein D3C79_751290 [compost metagenome]
MYRQMQEAHQLRCVFINRDDIVGEFNRMAGGETDAVDTVDGRHQAQQFGKRANFAVVSRAAIGVDVLAEQVDFAYALRRQLGDFKQDVIAWAADFFTAGIRHHAEGTVLVAAFHDGDEGGRAFGTRFRQAIEFFDFREADVDDGAAGALHVVEHFRQAVQGLRPEHDVDTGRAAANVFAFL